MTGFHLLLNKGVWYGVFEHFKQAGIKHGVSTRIGGESVEPFKSLNLGLHTGDVTENVKNNRWRFAHAVGVNLALITTAEQVHGDKVFLVGREHAGLGAEDYSQAIHGVDALVTNVPNLPLMLFFADCVPVLVADPVRHVVGVIHAGWKGTVAAIAQKTIETMAREYGTNPADCLAGIGPSVGQCCYEVDEAVISRLRQFAYWQELVVPAENRWRLDLWEANRRQLVDGGIKEENIIVSQVCTACNTELFYSYRMENGQTGRIGAVISL